MSLSHNKHKINNVIKSSIISQYSPTEQRNIQTHTHTQKSKQKTRNKIKKEYFLYYDVLYMFIWHGVFMREHIIARKQNCYMMNGMGNYIMTVSSRTGSKE